MTRIKEANIYDDNYGPAGIDANTNTLMTTTYEHHEIHSGSAFRVEHNQSNIPNQATGGELVIAFYVNNQTKQPHMVWEVEHEGAMTATIYEGVTFNANAGTDKEPINANRNSTNLSVLQGKATGVLVNNRVTFGENSVDAIYSGGLAIEVHKDYASRGDAGGGSGRHEFVLKPDTNYAFVLANNTTNTQGGQIRLDWYEHTPKN